jgi:hypothetical protein
MSQKMNQKKRPATRMGISARVVLALRDAARWRVRHQLCWIWRLRSFAQVLVTALIKRQRRMTGSGYLKAWR